jgi:hypothetical protein
VTKHSYLLLAAEQFYILSDHFNLKYMNTPLSLNPYLARHTVSKIQHWALKLARYNYRIEHIAGELNVLTDLLTRWGAAVTKTPSTPRNDSSFAMGRCSIRPQLLASQMGVQEALANGDWSFELLVHSAGHSIL